MCSHRVIVWQFHRKKFLVTQLKPFIYNSYSTTLPCITLVKCYSCFPAKLKWFTAYLNYHTNNLLMCIARPATTRRQGNLALKLFRTHLFIHVTRSRCFGLSLLLLKTPLEDGLQVMPHLSRVLWWWSGHQYPGALALWCFSTHWIPGSGCAQSAYEVSKYPYTKTVP